MKNKFWMKWVGFDPALHDVKTEILAGLTTFLTMAYILAVNPSMFSALAPYGMPVESVFTATILAAVAGTLVMALYAKKPFALAPGMGPNAFFVYTVCLGMGYDWRFALTAVFLEGLIFILLTASSLREKIVDAIPTNLKIAICAGIGLFITLVGLKSGGIVVSDATTLVRMGSLHTPDTLLALAGLVLTSVLWVFKVRGGLLLSILGITALGIPMGVTHYDGIFSTPPSVEPLLFQFKWEDIFTADMLVVVFTFLFVDLFDTIGTLVGVCVKAGMVDRKGKVDRMSQMLMADAVATVAGSCVGASTTATFCESAAGVSEGGRTGLTSLVVALLFAFSLFLSPLFLSIPAAATCSVLVIVGMLMMVQMTQIAWENYREGIPAFLTLILMPMCYSIADGILMGIISYVLINSLTGRVRKINPMLIGLAVLFILRYVFC